VEAVFRIYSSAEDGEPIWSETQHILVDSDGKYSVLLGAAAEGGLPETVFVGGAGRWLGISIERAPEQTRVPLLSVPYAMKAADAETLAGVPATEFVTKTQLLANAKKTTAIIADGSSARPNGASDGAALTIPRNGTISPLAGQATAATGTITGVTAVSPLTGGGTTGTVKVGLNTTALETLLNPFYARLGAPNQFTKLITFAPGQAFPGTISGVTATSPLTGGGATGTVKIGLNASELETVLNPVYAQLNAPNTFRKIITFAPGQTFPGGGGGTITGISTTSPLTGSGTTGSVTLSLDTSALETTLNSDYARLSAANTFLGNQAVSGNVSATGTLATEGPGAFDTSGVANTGLSGAGVLTGVHGEASGTENGVSGVSGSAGAATGMVYGVSGSIASTSNGAAGVIGGANATNGQSFGVSGYTNSTTDYASGVIGNASATSGVVYGVQGVSKSATANAAGVSGYASSTTGQVYGLNGGTNSAGDGAAGVNGFAGSTTGQVNGVIGGTNSPNGAGIAGFNNSTTGGSGVYGSTNATSGNGNGVIGVAPGSTGPDYNFGVQGVAGIHGVGVQGSSPQVGVAGFNQVCGSSGCILASGTAGEFVTGTGGIILSGLSGSGNPSMTKEVFYIDSSGDGYFAGDVNVTGKLTKGSGSFKIDHPLDPANKYLSHSFVESPDMMNVYNGNITTDQHGMATVTLPDYFEALNRDFRYQLTVIGQFAQAIVAKEINKNRFTIRTNRPSVKVSWQVTGIRQDAYANSNRIPVEENKPLAEHGYYLHPEVFGKPADRSIANAGKAEPAKDSKALGSR